MFRYFVLVVLVGCASAAPPIQGPEGAQGPSGDTGPSGVQGPAGPMGPPGASAVSVSAVDAGNVCAFGGALLVSQDGGAAAVCNGVQGQMGIQGSTGAQGIQGVQGPKGDHAYNLSAWSGDGGLIGSVFPDTYGHFNTVYVEDVGCAAQIDFKANTILPIQFTVYFAQPNCTGTAFIDPAAYMFPIGCLAVVNDVYKVQQPVVLRALQGQSQADFNGPPLADGGVTMRCAQGNYSSPAGAIVDLVQFPLLPGPFTFGVR